MRMPTCRFEPSCSAYAVDALNTHGLMHGGTLTVMRLLKCGPWHKPGYDPVPERGLRFYLPEDGVRPNRQSVRHTLDVRVTDPCSTSSTGRSPGSCGSGIGCSTI